MLFNTLIIGLALTSCTEAKEDGILPADPAAKAYWYDGQAEISSYTLKQARYGEVHEGNAVMVFVTEPFSKESWTKADNPNSEAIPVMKLNFTKNFNTGIYPYSIMTSTFFPFENGKRSAKISASMQEWCGHTYMELRNKKKLEVRVDSYFEGESDAKIELDEDYLEDDFWTIIRLNPDNLPTGTMKVIPAFAYLRMSHEELKAYSCELSRQTKNGVDTYTISYPDLDRQKTINFESEFPYRILSWEERYYSGWGNGRKKLTTTAKLNKSIRLDYWNKNTLSDSVYRQELGLDK